MAGSSSRLGSPAAEPDVSLGQRSSPCAAAPVQILVLAVGPSVMLGFRTPVHGLMLKDEPALEAHWGSALYSLTFGLKVRPEVYKVTGLAGSVQLVLWSHMCTVSQGSRVPEHKVNLGNVLRTHLYLSSLCQK